MKKPPSQRPEHQGPMHRLEVGKPYDPSRRAWPEGADYNFRAGGHELRIFATSLIHRKWQPCERAGSSSGCWSSCLKSSSSPGSMGLTIGS